MFERTRLDAAENLFFERELEARRAQSFDVKFPNNRAREFIPLDTSVDPGAETVAYEQYTMVGMARLLTSYSENIPRVDAKGVEFRSAIKSIADAYGYSLQEVRNAKMAGKPLETRKMVAARRAIEEKLDYILAFGDALTGLLGLLNQGNALAYTVAPHTALGTDTEWTGKTPTEILEDLNGIAQYVVDQTNGVEIPDTILLPPASFGHISTTPRSDASDTTILQYFLRNSPYIRNVDSWYRLNTAGTSSSKRMVCYRRSPDALQAVIPVDFESFPPQQKGLEFEVICHSRTGGVVAYYPLSIAYGDGI